MDIIQRLHQRYLLTMREVCDVTGMSEDSIRREMRKGLPSRLQNGRRFLTSDVVRWFKLDEPAPTRIATRVSEDAESLPASMLPTSRRAA
jgi:predicted DNA-binding transcriptional regulator AlpA